MEACDRELAVPWLRAVSGVAVAHLLLAATAQAACVEPKVRIPVEDQKKIAGRFLGFSLGAGVESSRTTTFEALVPAQDAVTFSWTKYLLCKAHEDGQISDEAYCTLVEVAAYRSLQVEADVTAIQARCAADASVAVPAPADPTGVEVPTPLPGETVGESGTPDDGARPAPSSEVGDTDGVVEGGAPAPQVSSAEPKVVASWGMPGDVCTEDASCHPATVCSRETCRTLAGLWFVLTIVAGHVEGTDTDGTPLDVGVSTTAACSARTVRDSNDPAWGNSCTLRYDPSYPPRFVLTEGQTSGDRNIGAITMTPELFASAVRAGRAGERLWIGPEDARLLVKVVPTSRPDGE